MTPSRLGLLGSLLLIAGCQAPGAVGGYGALGRLVLGISPQDDFAQAAPSRTEPIRPNSLSSPDSPRPVPSMLVGLPKLPPRTPPSPTPSASEAGAPAPAPHVDGMVVDLADRPLAGATVRTSDGRQSVTNDDGTFTLVGAYPADGVFSAIHPAYVASAVAGLGQGDPLTLHLQPRTEGAEETSDVQPERLFQVRGRLVDSAGRPAEDAWVTIADGHGASAVPVRTDAAGEFELTVSAPLPKLTDATLLAAGPDGMGVVSGLSATPSAPFLDFDPSDAAVSPLTLVAAWRTVGLTFDGTVSADASRTVELAAANGLRLSLEATGAAFAWAPQSGLTATVRVEAADGDLGLVSEFVHELGPMETGVIASLLTPPTFQGVPALTPDESLRWDAAAGADSYQLTLSGPGPLWEAFTGTPSLALSIADALPAGPYTLELTAWQGAGYAARTVAAAGPRALRMLPPAASYKRASRKLRIVRP